MKRIFVNFFLAWILTIKFQYVYCIPGPGPLISSSGMIPVEAPATPVENSVPSSPINLQPELEESTDESKRLERGSSIVIPIDSNTKTNKPTAAPTRPNQYIPLKSLAALKQYAAPIIEFVPEKSHLPDKNSKYIDTVLPPDNSILPFVQPVRIIQSQQKVIGPVSQSIANSGNMEAVESAILNGDSENKFSEKNWNQPIVKIGKPKLVEDPTPEPVIRDEIGRSFKSEREAASNTAETAAAQPAAAQPAAAPQMENEAGPSPLEADDSPVETTTMSIEEKATAIPINLKSESLFEVPNGLENNKVKNDEDLSSLYKVGPPWKDEKIVGRFMDGKQHISSIQVSFKLAAKLCQVFEKNSTEASGRSKRLYLWAPINQYIPLLHKGFPLREPLFAPECLKWVLRECRGTDRRPMLTPCTFWSPERIHRPECGFVTERKSMIVNYRMPYFVPGNCPCTWPCTRRFDPIQRCRVSISSAEKQLDDFNEDGDPSNQELLEIQENLAAQLCRGMRAARSRDKIVSIGWVPIRVEGKDELSGGTIVRKKREAAQREVPQQFHKAIKRQANKKAAAVPPPSKAISPTAPESTAPSENPKAQLKTKKFISPDDGSIAEIADVDKNNRFQQIVAYNPDPHLLEGNEALEGRGDSVGECTVWRYKPCEKDDDASLRYKRQTQHRGKRELAPVANNEKIVSDEEVKEDGSPPRNCGEWKIDKSPICIPETVVKNVVPQGRSDQSDEDDDNAKDGNSAGKMARRKVVKDLCPGSKSRFPCFLIRKKRSTLVTVDITSDEEDSEESSESDEVPDKKVAKRQTVGEGGGSGNPTDKASDQSATYYSNKIQMPQDPSCRCDWPCLPFFDKINRCYDTKGNILVDARGRFVVPTRSFRRSQKDPVSCINFLETDEIFCKIKEKRGS